MVEQPESSNFAEFADPEVDGYIEKARKTFDLDERVKVQSAAHRRINELQPYTFLFTLKSPVLWWNWQSTKRGPASSVSSRMRIPRCARRHCARSARSE